MPERNVIVILGPTASGKSTLGVSLAKKFGGVVISADSRQVYRGLNIGTAKITKTEMHGVKHYLLDVASSRSQYSVARYSRDVLRVFKHVPVTTPIFLVGGSPFYIDALLNPLLISPVPPNEILRRRLASWGTARLIGRLRKLAPARATSIDPANRRRIIRAIEIASFRGKKELPSRPPMRILKIGLSVPQGKLYQRIDIRVDERQNGIVRETRRLYRQGVSWKHLDSFGLEYRWSSKFLRGLVSHLDFVRRLKGDSHAFARRQMTWWKRDKSITWVTKPTQAVQLVKKHLTLSSRT